MLLQVVEIKIGIIFFPVFLFSYQLCGLVVILFHQFFLLDNFLNICLFQHYEEFQGWCCRSKMHVLVKHSSVNGNISSVISWILFLLIGGFMFFINNDQLQIFHRSKHRRKSVLQQQCVIFRKLLPAMHLAFHRLINDYAIPQPFLFCELKWFLNLETVCGARAASGTRKRILPFSLKAFSIALK